MRVVQTSVGLLKKATDVLKLTKHLAKLMHMVSVSVKSIWWVNYAMHVGPEWTLHATRQR